MYAIFGVVDVKPEHVRAFRAAIVRVAKDTASDEPGIVQYRILADADIPTRFYFFEIFRDGTPRGSALGNGALQSPARHG